MAPAGQTHKVILGETFPKYLLFNLHHSQRADTAQELYLVHGRAFKGITGFIQLAILPNLGGTHIGIASDPVMGRCSPLIRCLAEGSPNRTSRSFS